MPLAIISLPFPDLSILILIVLLIVGLAGLSFGGDWLTTGAASISANLNINPIVVGLTVVSIATSMPEMLTSLVAAKDNPGLALGNVIGSNVANTGLVLGVTALIAPIAIHMRLITREVPILIGITILFTLFAYGGFNRIEGIILLSIMASYLVYIVKHARAEPASTQAMFEEEIPSAGSRSTILSIGFLCLGAGVLALGADVLVGTSVELAVRMGVSDTLIGLTIIALGTSLPELAASVSAARAGHSDICAGNIIGSNLFNILLIGGSVATIIPIPVAVELFWVEFPILLLLTGSLFFIFKKGQIVSRKEGAVLVVAYFLILTLFGLSQTGYLF